MAITIPAKSESEDDGRRPTEEIQFSEFVLQWIERGGNDMNDNLIRAGTQHIYFDSFQRQTVAVSRVTNCEALNDKLREHGSESLQKGLLLCNCVENFQPVMKNGIEYPKPRN